MNFLKTNSKGQKLSKFQKVQDLITDGATASDAVFKPNLVAVIKNQSGDVARYCNTEELANQCKTVTNRQVVWLVYPKAEQALNAEPVNNEQKK